MSGEEGEERIAAVEARGDEDARPKRSGLWLFLVCLGTALAAIGLRALWRGFETLKWPRVEAEIVSSDVTVRTSASSSGTPSIGVVSGGRRDEFAAYAVSFRYTIDGAEHIAHGVERGDLGLQNSQKSRDLGFAHPVGSRARVVVNPADPDDAYVAPGPSSAAWMVTGVGTTLALVGLWIRAVSVAGGEAKTVVRRRRRGG